MALSEPRAVARVRDERGFTLVDMLFVLGLIAILSALAIPGLTRARGAAQSTSALATLRVVNSAELSYAIGCGLGFYSPDLPTLGIPPPGSQVPFLSLDMTGGIAVNKSGYNFQLFGTPSAGAPATCNGLAAGAAAPAYKVGADPLAVTNSSFYATNATGIVYEHSASMYAAMPESGAPAAGRIVQ